MELIEQEIIRLQSLIHEKQCDITDEERAILYIMKSIPSMSARRCFSPCGTQIDWWMWCVINGSLDRHVGEDVIEDFVISTVWMGIDHSFSLMQSVKFIFETMIFYNGPDEITEFQAFQERYSALEEAEQGHQRAIDLVKTHLEQKENDKRIN